MNTNNELANCAIKKKQNVKKSGNNFTSKEPIVISLKSFKISQTVIWYNFNVVAVPHHRWISMSALSYAYMSFSLAYFEPPINPRVTLSTPTARILMTCHSSHLLSCLVKYGNFSFCNVFSCIFNTYQFIN